MKQLLLLMVMLLICSCLNVPVQNRGGDLEAVVGPNITVGKQWAVFIAIDRYQEWGPLTNPVRDAKEIKDILLEHYYIDEVRELYDREATNNGIRQLLVGLRSQVGIDDSVFVFYAGHGHTDQETNTGFWIPADGQHHERGQANWLPNIQVRNMLNLLPARHVFLISDSCFSGDILDHNRGAPVHIDSNYYRQAYSKVSRMVMTSGSSERVPEPSEFVMRLKSSLIRAEGACVDPEYLFVNVREVQSTQPLLGAIRGSEHQDGGSFLFFRKQVEGNAIERFQTDTSVSATTGSISVTSDIAGEILINGNATGSTIKEGGTVTIANVSVGNTEVAVKQTNGTIVKAPNMVMVRQGQIVAVAIKRPVPTNMVRINGGTFTMGSPSSEAGRDDDEVQHRVTVSSFYMGKYEVTQNEYETVIGTNPSNWKGYNLPVEKVSWYDALVFCNKLSMREGLSTAYSINGSTDPARWGTVPTNSNATWNAVTIVVGSNGYRLPTEAQWEYACRAGTTTAYNTGSSINTNTGWYDGNNGSRTHPVGEKPANAWGLYDMHGNVWEWCWDWYGAYPTSTQTDPMGASSGTYRVNRGGSWLNATRGVRSAYRGGSTLSGRYYDIGFRLVRPAQ
jgi:formylglycine-generating enzyme required for sulfatase activity